tara:strand:+ start:729 stop:896 length:168 start_codon:yes stop_codon:yes gene_type:complete
MNIEKTIELVKEVYDLGFTVALRHDEFGAAVGMADVAWTRFQEILHELEEISRNA